MQHCMNCMKEFQDNFTMCPYCGHEVGTPQKELYFLPIGTLIQGRYEIGQAAGSGGFGITYRAWDHTLDKEVAVKEYYPVGMVNRIPGETKLIIYSGSRAKECAAGMERFLDEAKNMAKFNQHPNIINVYDFFEANNTAYIIMEFLDGINYKEYIKLQGGKVELDYALKVNEAVLEALKEVHSAGILHRDISPDNVFICRDERIKLIDFGAARFSDTEVARTRSVILKPGYAPPEQYQTKSKQGPWTDIYAVAAMLYRAVTGVVPEESVNRVEEDLLKPPMTFCPELNKNQNNAILRAMSLLPELRFQDADSFKRALVGDIKVKEVSRELSSRKIRRAILISIAAVLILVGAFFSYKSYNDKKTKAAILNEASISIWTYTDDNETPEEKEALIQEALSEFKGDYDQISIDVRVFKQEEYAEAIKKAKNENSLPTLFESSHLSVDELKEMKNIDAVFDFIEEDKYYYLDDYKKYFGSKKQLPLSFVVPVNYVNINPKVNENLSSASELVNQGDYMISDEDLLSYEVLFNSSKIKAQSISENDINAITIPKEKITRDENEFLNDEVACIISDSSKYEIIQSQMAGSYEIELVTEGKMIGSFNDVYSISSSANQDEKEAAIQVLVYLLSENGQDVLYVQNGCHLPLNRVVFNAYIDINREFTDLKDKLGNVEFAGEKQYLINTRKED